MQSNDRKKMIQQGFDTVVACNDHLSLTYFYSDHKLFVVGQK